MCLVSSAFSSCCRPPAMSNTAQRKRMSVGSLLASGCPKPRGRAHARRVVHANTRANASRVARRRASPPDVPAPAAGETIDVMDNLEDGVEEVVDLTSEAAEASHVVDLTSSDSVLLPSRGRPLRCPSWWMKVLRAGETRLEKVTSSAAMTTRPRLPCPAPTSCPRSRRGAPAGLHREPSAAQCAWTRTRRWWRAGVWWCPPSAVTSSAASACVTPCAARSRARRAANASRLASTTPSTSERRRLALCWVFFFFVWSGLMYMCVCCARQDSATCTLQPGASGHPTGRTGPTGNSSRRNVPESSKAGPFSSLVAT
ncbi:E3 ubiquitin-protein ligase RNF4 isoform X2 [Hippocampus comes]|uniref:E3 ubiquitin-protein ligase RNF4 isoform X2 n=2 Tax=Hippocampus comes TaxID=109280 RepID=UPI00094E3454|nr:PREDICTED: E3 ubiquitin-protein ligase RNF4 isoform X2 [Hippocampus comes]